MRQTLQGARRVLRQRGFRRFWLGLLPLLAPALRTLGGARAAPGLPKASKT